MSSLYNAEITFDAIACSAFSTERIQVMSGLRGYFPSWSSRSTEAKCNQGKDPLLRFISKIMSSITGMSGMMEGMPEEDAGSKFERMIFIMNSMSAQDLDSDVLIFVSGSVNVPSVGLFVLSSSASAIR